MTGGLAPPTVRTPQAPPLPDTGSRGANPPFLKSPEIVEVGGACQLIVCSDGATEAEAPDGIPFGNDGLLRTLRDAPAGERLARLKQDLALHCGGRSALDDISVLIVDCAGAALEPTR